MSESVGSRVLVEQGAVLRIGLNRLERRDAGDRPLPQDPAAAYPRLEQDAAPARIDDAAAEGQRAFRDRRDPVFTGR